MTEVSSTRLWVMRGMYLLMAVGIAGMTWPLVVSHPADMPRMTTVAIALISTIGLLSLLGLRYPLQMLPVLLFELGWKILWLVAFALPRWRSGALDEAWRTSIVEVSFGMILLLVIPWRYVWANYFVKPGAPWTVRGTRPAAEQHA